MQPSTALAWVIERMLVNCSLVADGSSDRALIPLIERLLLELRPGWRFSSVQFERLTQPTLGERVRECLARYPCDLLFVHRDAEGESIDQRMREIETSTRGYAPNSVAVVPVKMTEAWLLTNEASIREAVGNLTGTAPLSLPTLAAIERVDAKEKLDAALTSAANLNRRRTRMFRAQDYRFRVAECTHDLERLRKLSSFASFEERLEAVLRHLGTQAI